MKASLLFISTSVFTVVERWVSRDREWEEVPHSKLRIGDRSISLL